MVDTPRLQTKHRAGFYGLEDAALASPEGNTVEAVVGSNQVLVDGAVLQLRLSTDVYINGTLIPKGAPINGIVSLNGERLEASIHSIRWGTSVFPIKLQLYDLDGLPGIHIPGSISRDVAKQAADNNLQMLDMASLDPSLKAQAAAAGLSTVKNLVSRKVKQVKVRVKAGHKVLLLSKEA